VEIGKDVRLNKDDGLSSLRDAIFEGTRLGYAEGYLRKSVLLPSYTPEDVRRRQLTARYEGILR
jgi:hypothetical protein